jgi:hypothetical protein
MGQFLTTASVLQCPHGGIVSAITTNAVAQAVGDYIVRSSDTFMIAGCPFVLPTPPPTPHPCMTVQWVVSALMNQVMSDSVLTEDSVGMCLAADQTPQGPVLISFTQPLVSGV